MEWFFLGALVALIGAVGEWLEKKEQEEPDNTKNLPPAAHGDNPPVAEPYNHPYTQDDIIYKDGRYYENENSEDWEEFEYEISEDERFK